MRKIKIVTKDFIIVQVINNLLHAQHVAAKAGDCNGSIKIARLLLKLAEKYGNKMVNFTTINSNEDTNSPPDKAQ